MTVKFLQSWNEYRPGEIEILPTRLARLLIKAGVCEVLHILTIDRTHSEVYHG